MKKLIPSLPRCHGQTRLSVLLVFSFCAMLSALCALAPAAMAAESVVQTWASLSSNTSLLTFTWTSAANGSLTATASARSIDGWVILVVTNPGATAPTDDYDITLTDADGVDVMGGQLADRDQTNSEHAVPQLQSGVFGERYVSGTLTLNLSNNSVNSATGVVKVYIRR